MFGNLRKKIIRRLVEDYEQAAAIKELVQECLEQMLEYEPDGFGEQQKNNLKVEIAKLKEEVLMNNRMVRYLKPLL